MQGHYEHAVLMSIASPMQTMPGLQVLPPCRYGHTAADAMNNACILYCMKGETVHNDQHEVVPCIERDRLRILLQTNGTIEAANPRG